jgi:hypothetical protein
MALLEFANNLELLESSIELDGSGADPAFGRGREVENPGRSIVGDGSYPDCPAHAVSFP